MKPLFPFHKPSLRSGFASIALAVGLLLCASPVQAQSQRSAPVQTAPAAAPQIHKGRIIFHGQAPGNTNYGHIDPLDACPNIVTVSGSIGNPAGNVVSQPYRFEFDTECLGNYYNLGRPPFVWTIKYLTESGRIYEEQLGDYTKDDYSKMMFYLYDRVPTNGTTPSNQTATANSGNGNTFVTIDSGTSNTAQPGELIYGVRLECTGYSCKVTDDEDGIDIRYYGRRPDAITLTGSLPACRNLSYPLSISPVVGATSYTWSATGGATVSGSGTNVTLNLGNVTPGLTSVTVRVAAVDNAHCGGSTSATRDLVVNLALGSAALQNIDLSNGLCPTTGSDTKTASIQGSAGVTYRWTISGPAGTAITGTTEGVSLTSVPVVTPTAGPVTISVSAKSSDCTGYSPVFSKTFQIGPLVPVCKQFIDQVYYPCSKFDTNLIFEGTPTGLNYYFNAVRNVTPATTTITIQQTTAGRPVFGVNRSGSFSNGAVAFDLDYIIQSPCPATASGGLVFCTIHVELPSTPSCRSSEDTPLPAAVQLYPNPTTGAVEIQADKSVQYQWVRVYDAQGVLRDEQRSDRPEGIRSLHLESLLPGIYQVQLYDGQQLVSKRLQKK